MAINANLLPRQSDRRLFLIAAIGFPLLVLIGYFKSYYFSTFFDVKPLANSLVHAHGIVMSAWVIYFVVQVALIRSKNIKLHMAMGMAGIALAALVVVVGLATAYDAQLVRQSAPPGTEPHKFFIIPVGDMLLFVVYFAGAIYYRKRAAEHKSLMLLSAINFLPAAFARMPFIPEQGFIFWIFGMAATIAVLSLIWFTLKHRKLNKVFALGVLLLIAALPLRLAFAETAAWHSFTNWLGS
jgi:hypothetical protein